MRQANTRLRFDQSLQLLRFVLELNCVQKMQDSYLFAAAHEELCITTTSVLIVLVITATTILILISYIFPWLEFSYFNVEYYILRIERNGRMTKRDNRNIFDRLRNIRHK